jgi:hypothetical protein
MTKVITIFTFHTDETQKVTTQRGQEKVKPVAVLNYSFTTRGLGLKDQLPQRCHTEMKNE